MATQDEILSGLLGGIPGGALTQGLLATSAGLLAAGGPSYEPRSLGGALGAGMMGGLNAYQQAQQNTLSQYLAATKMAQQLRQQQALTDLSASMSPQMRNLALANPEAFTKAMAESELKISDHQKKIRDYQAGLQHHDPIIREAAVANLASESPWFKAQVAGVTAAAGEQGRFYAIPTGELAAREGAVTSAREAATLPFAGPRAAATAGGSFYATPQRIGDALVMIPAPGAPAPPGATRMGAGATSVGAGAPGAPAAPGAPSVVYSAPRDAEKTASMEDTLRQQFAAAPEVKAYKDVAAAYNSAVAAGNNLAGDLNLVYAFAKAMDPGSVVREGEQVMVMGTGAAAERLRGWINSIQGGARLTPEIRANLINELNTRVDAWANQYGSLRSQFEDAAKSRGLNVRNVLDQPVQINRQSPPAATDANSPPTIQPRRRGDPSPRRSLNDIFQGGR